MVRKISLLLIISALFTIVGNAQTKTPISKERKHFVSSSAFVLANLIDSETSPSFYQLNFGCEITPKDIIIIEAITWKYYAPLGIPYGESFDDKTENFPGSVRDFGIGVAYQRFLWKGLYSTAHVTPFVQQYFDTEGKKIQTGFMLFTTLRLGYRVKLFTDRFFIEPSVAVTHWPVNTNLPASFAERENKWSNYFLFEPGFHLGFKF